jgi:hypothetical protein
MTISREEQLKILGRMKDSDIDYTDAPATNADFWQNATINIPPVKEPVTLKFDPKAAKASKAVSSAPKGSKKAEPAAQDKKSGRLSSLAFRPLYQGSTLTDAIEKVLQERKGESVNADSVVKAVYGDLPLENFRQAKDLVTKNLSKGKLDGKWERVPNQLGYYTLSISLIKS